MYSDFYGPFFHTSFSTCSLKTTICLAYNKVQLYFSDSCCKERGSWVTFLRFSSGLFSWTAAFGTTSTVVVWEAPWAGMRFGYPITILSVPCADQAFFSCNFSECQWALGLCPEPFRSFNKIKPPWSFDCAIWLSLSQAHWWYSGSWYMLTFPTEVSNSISEHLTAVSLWMYDDFLTLNTSSRRLF